MQSTAKTVTEHLEEVPAERKAALTQLRHPCCSLLTGFEELMQYGDSSYARNGEIEVGFACQKHFIGLYSLRSDVMNAHCNLLQGRGISLGKGCKRYSRPERIDFNVVEVLLKTTVASSGPICD